MHIQSKPYQTVWLDVYKLHLCTQFVDFSNISSRFMWFVLFFSRFFGFFFCCCPCPNESHAVQSIDFIFCVIATQSILSCDIEHNVRMNERRKRKEHQASQIQIIKERKHELQRDCWTYRLTFSFQLKYKLRKHLKDSYQHMYTVALNVAL